MAVGRNLAHRHPVPGGIVGWGRFGRLTRTTVRGRLPAAGKQISAMTEQIAASHLVYTKLNQPRITTQLVERKRLYTALNLQRPLAIVVAPAGYGKTTLVSSWASQSGIPCAWLSLDAGDNQLSIFVDYLLAAIQRLFPDLVRQAAVGQNNGAVTALAVVAVNSPMR